MTNRQKSFLAFIVLVAILAIGLLASCSSPEKLLRKAIERGAKVTTDTVYQEVITERTITDTVTHFQTVNRILAADTIRTETVRWKSKTVIDTLTKTVYQQVECKPDTLRIPVRVETTISAGYTKTQLIGSLIALALLMLGVGYVFLRLKG